MDYRYEVQMQTNHISHFLLTHLLLGVLEQASVKSGESRVVQHSSNARLRTSGSENNVKGELEAMYFQKSEPGSLGGDTAAQNFGRYHQTKLANTVGSFLCYFTSWLYYYRCSQWCYIKSFKREDSRLNLSLLNQVPNSCTTCTVIIKS